MEIQSGKTENVFFFLFIIFSCVIFTDAGITTFPAWVSVLCQYARWAVFLGIIALEIRRVISCNYFYDIRPIVFSVIPYYLLVYFGSYVPIRFPIVGFLILALFLNRSDEDKIQIYEWFKWFMILVSGIGIVCFVNSVFGVGLPYTEHVRQGFDLNDLGTHYMGYIFSFVMRGNDGLFRLCGIFNEPGYLGTVLGLMLTVEKLNFKKKENIVMFVAGCCTLSLAFIVLIIMAYLLKSISNFHMTLITILIFGSFLFAIQRYEGNNVFLKTISYRLSFDSSGNWQGDSRFNTLAAQELDTVLSGDAIFFGRGYGYLNVERTGGGIGGIKIDLVNFGVLGTFITLVFPLGYAFYLARNSFDASVYVICYLVNLYNRNETFSLLYMLLLFGGIAYIGKSKKQIVDGEH